MTGGNSAMISIPSTMIQTNGHAAPGKLADAEIHFTGGELDGLKLVGFAVWRSRDGDGQNVSFPSRHFTFNGSRRSFSMLRWISERDAEERLEALVLSAYKGLNGNATTIYAGGLYERETLSSVDTDVHYIFAGGEVVAVHKSVPDGAPIRFRIVE